MLIRNPSVVISIKKRICVFERVMQVEFKSLDLKTFEGGKKFVNHGLERYPSIP